VVLAADTLSDSTAAAGIFRDAAAGPSVWQPADPAACGCADETG
jgi:hypothetical protein